MRVASSQPTFLSYPGYFGLIDYVDKFIIMDDVQFASRGWQQRVLVKINKNPNYLTIPVVKKNLRSQLILETKIDNSKKYINDHLLTIKHSYSKYPFFKEFFPEIEFIYKKRFDKLIELNLEFIFYFLKILEIDKNKIVRLSQLDLNKNTKKDDLIHEICLNVDNTSEYVATEGARTYLKKNIRLNKDFKIRYFMFRSSDDNLHEYNGKPCHLSIIHYLFSYGRKTKEIIRSNFVISKN